MDANNRHNIIPRRPVDRTASQAATIANTDNPAMSFEDFRFAAIKFSDGDGLRRERCESSLSGVPFKGKPGALYFAQSFGRPPRPVTVAYLESCRGWRVRKWD